MESLCYAFEGRELLFSDDIELPGDMKRPFDFDKNTFVPIREGDGGIEFKEFGLPDTTRKLLLDGPVWSSTAEMDDNPTSTNIFNLFPREMELGSRFSSSSIGAGDKTSPQINLKVEDLAARREINRSPISQEKYSVSSSPDSQLPATRSVCTNLHSRLPVCQVYGCNKDLSSSKDYHKRHKVCDVHSKTAVVIVNGIEQRFCQQCSRFHMLAEFDEGKRSCRERLAGHNKRRRKFQLDTHLGRRKFQLDTHLGHSFLGSDLSRSSFLLSGILPGGFFPQRIDEPSNNYSKRIKFEGEMNQRSELAMPMKFWQSCAKSLQYPSKNCLDSRLSIQELSHGSKSGFAPSLLSNQSHDSLSNSAGIPKDFPQIFEENNHANSRMDQNLDGLFRESNAMSAKNYCSPEVAETIDLLELSFHLERVELQRHSAQVKQENDMFCFSTIT